MAEMEQRVAELVAGLQQLAARNVELERRLGDVQAAGFAQAAAERAREAAGAARQAAFSPLIDTRTLTKPRNFTGGTRIGRSGRW